MLLTFFFFYFSSAHLRSFFFSCRRRHTRWPRDWSSDVCSSDLGGNELALTEGHRYQVSFRIRAENPTSATISLDAGAGAQIWGRSISAEDWITVESSVFTAGADETRAFGIHLSADANPVGQVFFIDDMAVEDLDAHLVGMSPIFVEAEDGDIGSEFEEVEEDDVTFIRITTDTNESSGATGYPGEDRTASYTVVFPEGGPYALYARVRVGPANADDDSFFYGRSTFGEKDPADPEDWTMVN